MLDKFFDNYFYGSTYFALGHLIVLFFFVWSCIVCWLEARALQSFAPVSKTLAGKAKKRQLVGVLDTFVEECKVQAEYGNFVPMTDFSDRLDSIVDGLISQMHDRANLFLIVGIMGTMWGVFEFAVTSQINSDVAKLAENLSSSIGKAFPVGILGIALTILAQFVVAFPERKLRSDLAHATHAALKHRKPTTKPADDAVLKALGEIRTAVEGLQQMNLVVQPLVQELQQSVKPILSEFAAAAGSITKEVSKSVEDLKTTSTAMVQKLSEPINALNKATDSLAETTRGVSSNVEKMRESTNQSLKTLSDATTDLKSLLENTPKVLDNFVQIQEGHKKWLEAFRSDLVETINAIQKATKQTELLQATISNLPENLKKITENEMQELRTSLTTVWSEEAKTVSEKIYGAFKQHLFEMEGKAAETVKKIQEAGEAYDVLLARLSEVEGRIVDAIVKKIVQGEPEIVKSFTQLVEHLKQTALTAKAAKDELDKWKDEVLKIQEGIQEVNQSIDTSGKNFSEALKRSTAEFEKQVNQIAHNLSAFDTRPIIEKLGKSTRLLSHIAKTNPVIALQILFSPKLRELLRSTRDESDS